VEGYIFDYRLGYVRAGCGLQGFDVIGGESADKLVALGGYTTPEQAKAGKSWAGALQGIDGRQMLCGCTDGYSSAQILTMFIREVPLLAPKLVVCLSGFYNIAYRLGFIQNNKWHNKKDAAFLSLHPFATPGHLHFYRKITSRFGLGNDEVFYGEENAMPAWELWLRHMGDINCLCEEFGIGFKALLQPCAFSGGYRRNERENASLREYYSLNNQELEDFHAGFRREYAEIASRAKGLGFIRDISGLFDGCEDVYTDACHVQEEYLPALSAEIKEAIF
jgi:hypothetical protein